jgi:hypothetical protein
MSQIDAKTALAALEALRSKYANYGAADTEGREAIYTLEDCVRDGKRFPFPDPNRNPFSLYSASLTAATWQPASAELVAAAKVYYRALIAERYGVSVEAE